MSNFVLCCGAFALLTSAALAQTTGGGPFRVRFNDDGVASLQRSGDPAAVEYVASGRVLGRLAVRYRMGSSEVREFSTAGPVKKSAAQGGQNARERVLIYNESGWNDYYADLEVSQRFRLEGDALYWTLHIRNLTHKPVELGDVVLSSAIGHAMERFAVGQKWYPYWKAGGTGSPALLMLPVTVCPLFEPAKNERNFKAGAFEHAGEAGLYVHAAYTAPSTGSSHTLTPKFSPDDEVTWTFKFVWAADRAAIEKALSGEGLLSDANGAPE